MAEELEVRQNAPTGEDPELSYAGEHAACVELAWDLLAQGIHTWRAIARGVNEASKIGCRHTHEWAQRAVRKHSQMVGELLDDPAINHRAKYLQGLHVDLAAQAVIANKPGAEDRDRIAARKAMTDIREKIAALSFIVTERKGVEHSGSVDVDFGHLTNEQVVAIATNGGPYRSGSEETAPGDSPDAGGAVPE
jgi:hypothetical protein